MTSIGFKLCIKWDEQHYKFSLADKTKIDISTQEL